MVEKRPLPGRKCMAKYIKIFFQESRNLLFRIWLKSLNTLCLIFAPTKHLFRATPIKTETVEICFQNLSFILALGV